jgi:3-methyladenine DNA glycosylase AlkC
MYNQQTVGDLAAAFRREYPRFDTESFLNRVFDEDWEGRELKARMRHITTVLHDHVPGAFSEALTLMSKVLPTLADQGFEKMVFPDFVEVYGQETYDQSMSALAQFTQYVSAEFAVRPFIDRYLEKAMAQMYAWAGHPHAGVRRLASEGCRPRLPWAMALPALKADPSPILPILERLKRDESESVRRSVANNLNDISKDNPEVVIETLRKWQERDSKEIEWITRHALRTLLKDGRPEALELLGYSAEPAVEVHGLTVAPDRIPSGGEVTFSFEISSQSSRAQRLMIDYAVHLMRANGKQTVKVFKLSKKSIQPGETIRIERKHSFRPVTTRKYYPGEHLIQPQINGKLFGRVTFELE